MPTVATEGLPATCPPQPPPRRKPEATVVDVQALIDVQSLAAPEAAAVALLPRGIAIDGFDTAIIGFIAPAIRGEWRLGVGQLGPSRRGFGLMLGAFAVGPLADRHGRKAMSVASMIVFGAATWRLVSGGVTSLNRVALRPPDWVGRCR